MEGAAYVLLLFLIASVPISGAFAYWLDGALKQKLTVSRWVLLALASAFLIWFICQWFPLGIVVTEVGLWLLLAVFAHAFDWPRVAGCMAGLITGFGVTMWAGFDFFHPWFQSDIVGPEVFASFMLAIPVALASAWVGWRIGAKVKNGWASTIFGLGAGAIVGLLLAIYTYFSPAHHPYVEDTAAEAGEPTPARAPTPAPGAPLDESARE